MIYAGIDRLLHDNSHYLTDLLVRQRVGLVTNDVATTLLSSRGQSHALTPTRVALLAAGVNLVRLFAPEHGIGAVAADGAEIDDEIDALTGLPVISLYGATFKPTAESLADLDLLLFDIPDVGARFYTYIWTLSYLLEACTETRTPLWVLDRPNPLGGDLSMAEGPMLMEGQVSSFIGRWSIPVRHSLTAGELARLWNQERQLGVDLTVIPVDGWEREQRWPEGHVPFIPASPAMPSYETALLYPGTCFFEGTNISEGRGTATPFRSVGAPWIQPYELALHFNQIGVPGVIARGVEFTPLSSKYQGQNCYGVMLHVTESDQFRPVSAGLTLLALSIRLYAEQFEWLPYPTAAAGQGFGHFDRLVGQVAIRPRLAELAQTDWDECLAQISRWTEPVEWSMRVEPILLY